QAHPNVELELAPADLVMASGSGLDPNITLTGALYQVPRVAAARTEMLVKEGKVPADRARRTEVETRIRDRLAKVLHEHASAPLGGLVGVPLETVLEVNLAVGDAVAEAIR